MPQDQVHHVAKALSWWLRHGPDGWRFHISGGNWHKSSGPFPTEYEAQRAALAVFAEARA